MNEPEKLIPLHGGYRKLKSFQVAQLAYDVTVRFQSTVSIKSTFAEISANGALALITVACSLLERQIAAQEKAFLNEGGFTERLYRVRSAHGK